MHYKIEKAQRYIHSNKDSGALGALINDPEWDDVLEIILDKSSKKLDNIEFNLFINKAYNEKNLPIFKKLCEVDNSEVNYVVEVLLDKALNERSWDYVEPLCFFQYDIPSPASINKVLFQAATSYKWELVEKLSSLKGKKAPYQITIDKVLSQAFESSEWEVVKKICANEVNPPSKDQLQKTLIEATKKNNLALVKFLFTLSHPLRPEQEAIELAFNEAALLDNIDFINFFMCLIEDYNWHIKPLQLIELLKRNLFHASKKNHLNVVKVLCERLTEIDPDSMEKVIGIVLDAAAQEGNTQVIQYFCETYKLDDQNKKEAFFEAASRCHIDSVSYFSKFYEKGDPIFTQAVLFALPNKEKSDDHKLALVSCLIEKINPSDLEEIIAEVKKKQNELGSISSVAESLKKLKLALPASSSAPNTNKNIQVDDRDLNSSSSENSSESESSQETEHSDSIFYSINSMQILGLFIGALGITAVALAFTVIAAASGGIVPLVIGVAALGATATVIGIGFFAKGSYDCYKMHYDDEDEPSIEFK